MHMQMKHILYTKSTKFNVYFGWFVLLLIMPAKVGGDAILPNEMESMRNIPQDAKTQNGCSKTAIDIVADLWKG